jgi:hypothetical protein
MLMFQYFPLDVSTTVVIPIVREGCATRSLSFVTRFATRPYPIVLLLRCRGANHLNCDSGLKTRMHMLFARGHFITRILPKYEQAGA